MSTASIDEAMTEFVRATGERAAMIGTFAVSSHDFEPMLRNVRDRLGSLLRDDELQTLREATHRLGRAVGQDPLTTSAHADFRATVDAVKSDVILRSLGALRA